MKKPRWFLTNAQKVINHLHGRVQHIIQNIFRITSNGNERITSNGNQRITSNSSY